MNQPNYIYSNSLEKMAELMKKCDEILAEHSTEGGENNDG